MDDCVWEKSVQCYPRCLYFGKSLRKTMTVLALELDSSHCCHLALACQFQRKLRGESRGKKVTTFKVKGFKICCTFEWSVRIYVCITLHVPFADPTSLLLHGISRVRGMQNGRGSKGSLSKQVGFLIENHLRGSKRGGSNQRPPPSFCFSSISFVGISPE